MPSDQFTTLPAAFLLKLNGESKAGWCLRSEHQEWREGGREEGREGRENRRQWGRGREGEAEGGENEIKQNKTVWNHKLSDQDSEQEVITKLSLEIPMGGYPYPAIL